MDIFLHADVYCSDGLVGESTYIIVDLVTERVTHVVVKTKQTHREYLVPLDMVSSADRETILVNCNKDEIDDLTPFQAAYFHGPDNYGGSPPVPSAGTEASLTLYQPYRTAELGKEAADVQPPAVQLAINKGAQVLATDGEVGMIDELVIDPKTHRITHLVLRKHNLVKKIEVTIPISEIERVEMDTVFLKIDKNAVASLPTVTLKKFPWE